MEIDGITYKRMKAIRIDHEFQKVGCWSIRYLFCWLSS